MLTNSAVVLLATIYFDFCIIIINSKSHTHTQWLMHEIILDNSDYVCECEKYCVWNIDACASHIINVWDLDLVGSMLYCNNYK